jgi:choline dehydrogenase
LGGSGSINGCFFVRGRPGDFTRWAELGNRGWAYEDVLPYFRAIERFDGDADPTVRGQAGPFHVETLRSPHPLARRFVEAARQCGIPSAADYNGSDASGAAIAQTSIREGFRETSFRAFLRPSLARRNLRLLTGRRATRVVIEHGEACGVEVAAASGTRMIRARREVILCAGAIGSPHILLLSGVGPAAELQKVGVQVATNLPGVGANLQEHVGLWIVHALKPGTRTLNMDYGWLGILRHGVRFVARRDGPAASPSAHALAFASSDPSLTDPDLQIHFMPLGYRITANGIEIPPTPAMMAVPNVNRPLSRGRLRLASSNSADAPLIEPSLLQDSEDVRRLIAGCRLARRIFGAPAFVDFADRESFPGRDCETDGDWESAIRAHAGPVYHIAGTCKMGLDPFSVVDPALRVRGIAKLRVIDSSIMPVITSGNTNATALMIGAKGVDLVLESSRLP